MVSRDGGRKKENRNQREGRRRRVAFATHWEICWRGRNRGGNNKTLGESKLEHRMKLGQRGEREGNTYMEWA